MGPSVARSSCSEPRRSRRVRAAGVATRAISAFYEASLDICPAGERLAYSFTTQEHGLILQRYLTNACQNCAIKHRFTTSKERRITRWEHEHILEAVQRRLDEHPEKMRQRRETVEHPFGTIKARMRATHFLMKTLPRVASEIALHVLAYNLTRVMNIMGIQSLMAVNEGIVGPPNMRRFQNSRRPLESALNPRLLLHDQDPGHVKTLRGITAPGILRLVVTIRAKKCGLDPKRTSRRYPAGRIQGPDTKLGTLDEMS